MVSVSDVVATPANPVAWATLLADVACAFIPGLTGGGSIIRAVTKTDDVIDAAKAVYKASDKASDIRKATGSYEIVYKNGTSYVGKGGFKRAINSASRYSNQSGVASITWTKASNRRNAFINEYTTMCRRGGPNNSMIRNTKSHNRMWSPGRKYYYQDYGKYYNYGGRSW